MKRVMSGEENSELLMLVCSKLKFFLIISLRFLLLLLVAFVCLLHLFVCLFLAFI